MQDPVVGAPGGAPQATIHGIAQTQAGLVPTERELSAGLNHTCGLTSAGAAWCWGHDTHFQLGNGEAVQIDQTSPVAVEGGHLFGRTAPALGPRRAPLRRR
jgi:alpha-tubulin suppressor-like RCC1 family protein